MITITEDNIASYLLQWELEGKREVICKAVPWDGTTLHTLLYTYLDLDTFNNNGISYQSKRDYKYDESSGAYYYDVYPKNKITKIFFEKLNLPNVTIKKGIVNRLLAYVGVTGTALLDLAMKSALSIVIILVLLNIILSLNNLN